jgi:hypothetical protein
MTRPKKLLDANYFLGRLILKYLLKKRLNIKIARWAAWCLPGSALDKLYFRYHINGNGVQPSVKKKKVPAGSNTFFVGSIGWPKIACKERDGRHVVGSVNADGTQPCSGREATCTYVVRTGKERAGRWQLLRRFHMYAHAPQ